jgi:precorrin-2/cobalt-factor-2 C20-methyltransferase
MGGSEAMSGTVYGLGVGPGDPELITLKAKRILARVPVVAYPATETGESLARDIAAPHIGNAAAEIPIRIPIYAGTFPDETLYDEAVAAIGTQLADGRDVAVLCEGDPFFYGSFMYLFARLAERHRVEVVPGVSSLTASAAALGAPLAARNDVLAVLPATLPEDVLTARLEASDAAAIIKVGRHLEKVRAVVAKLDLTGHARYIERATMANQKTAPLAEVDAEAAPYFSMILVHRRGEAWR